MNALQEATRLARSGQFADAANVLDAGPIDRAGRSGANVLRAELLERLGRTSEARTQAENLLASRNLVPAEQSAVHVVLSRTEIQRGHFDSALTHLQQAVGLAQAAGDWQRVCWAQLRLLFSLSEDAGPCATAAIIADLRRNVARTGDPILAAALHIFVAQVDAKQGLLSSARRHADLGLALLDEHPNAWLALMAENIQAGIAIMRVDTPTGIRHADRAVEFAALSGTAPAMASALGNLANLRYLAGDYDRAVELIDGCASDLVPRSGNYVALFDTLANIRLAQNRLDDCREVIDQIVEMTASYESRTRYAYRHSLLPRARLLHRCGEVDEALALADTAIRLSSASGDSLLLHLTVLMKANLLASSSRDREALDAMEPIADSITMQPPHVYALYEQVLACGLSNQNRPRGALDHLARARRIFNTLRHAPALVDLEWAWLAASTDRDATGISPPPKDADRDAVAPMARAFQGIAALHVFGDRTDLLARELVEMVSQAECATSVTAVLRRERSSDETLWTACVTDGASDVTERRLVIGPFRDGEIDLVMAVKPDMESVATFNAIRLLLNSLHELDRARIEREERATLWPAEDLPIDGGHSVIAGQMREQMELARRIARTNVNVLITGESGTGKDILARAIHGFSARAAKPFVAFNCAAIPRDLLESQLFGHRRGAFTGADRDHAGVIRSARDGTLFLDEIGELSLDLQPKLLRFLESGEIAPLGEPALTVDVRIVAATNSNLEDAVRAGKFREDLFYRLNVVRLSLRPLRERRDEIPGLVQHFIARAAEEFDKGHIRISEEALERLILYRWPGNVRQLQNEVRRMVALAEPNSTLGPTAISDQILGALPLMRPTVNGTEIAVSLHDKLLPTLARIESEMIKAALTQHRGRMDAVAKSLGISRKGLYLKRQRLGL